MDLLATVQTNAHVTARHDDGIGLFGEADGALLRLLGRLALHVLCLALRGDFVRVLQSVNAFDFEGQPVDQYDLLHTPSPCYLLLRVLNEDAVVNECEVLAAQVVVDRQYQRRVLRIILAKFILAQCGEFEIYFAEHYLLLHAWG